MLFFPPNTLVGPQISALVWCRILWSSPCQVQHLLPAFTTIMLDFRASVAKRISQTYNGRQQLVLDVSQPVEFVWVLKTGAANR